MPSTRRPSFRQQRRNDHMLEQPTAQPTIVSFLLDRTGSKQAIKDETIGGLSSAMPCRTSLRFRT